MNRITIKNLSKRFRIGFKKNQSALARIISLISGREPRRWFFALKDISLKLESGEILGLVGKNGSGKSTLLRVIAGIYQPTIGSLRVNGKIVSLIGLGGGFNERLTMHENIFLVGSIFGMSQTTIKKRYKSIVELSELGEFINTKLYQFSEGMKQRLAFSIAILAKPEIMLLDEVFEVGDADFRRKSAEKIKKLVKWGASVILVSHEIWMIKKYCDRVVLLDKGKIKEQGKTEKIIDGYEVSLR